MVKFTTADGQRLVFPLNDDVARFLNAGWYEFREIGFFYRFLRKGDRLLDIGAHCGLYSAIANSVVTKTGYVLAVEPGADLADYIVQNLGVKGPVSTPANLAGEGCEWLQAAAMHQPGEVYLSIDDPRKSAYREVSMERSSGVAVPAITGDQITAHLGRGFDLIKIDVEGAECEVLEGLADTLDQYPAAVLMIEFTETNQARRHLSTKALADLIRSKGLSLFEFDDANCRLQEVGDGLGFEHRNLFACRYPEDVNRRLQSAPAKQVFYSEEVFDRGRASESLYSETLLFKNFRARGLKWIEQIADTLRYLRGDPEDAMRKWRDRAAEAEAAKTVDSKVVALASLIEDGLGQVHGTSAYLAKALDGERRAHEVLKRQVAEAEALIDKDPRLEPLRFDVAIRAGMEALASDVLLLQELRLLLPANLPADLVQRLDAYSARTQRDISDAVTNKIELERVKPLMISASLQLGEAMKREAALERALAASKAELASYQVQQEGSLTEAKKQLAACETELRAARDELVSSIAKQQGLLADAMVQIATGERELQTAQSELALATRRAAQAESSTANLVGQLDALGKELSEVQADLGSANASLHLEKAKSESQQSDILSLRLELSGAVSHAEALAAKAERLSLAHEQEAALLTSHLADAAASADAEKAIAEALRSELEFLRLELLRAEDRMQALEEDSAKTSLEFARKLGKLESDLFDAVTALGAEIAKAGALQSELELMKGALADADAGAQASIEEALSQSSQYHKEVGELKFALEGALLANSKDRSELDLLRAEISTLKVELGLALGSVQERDESFKSLLEETDRLLSELSIEHRAELAELRLALSQSRSAAEGLATENEVVHALAQQKSEKLGNVLAILSESARELEHLAKDTRSDHETLRDLVRSIRASRLAALAAVFGMGPRRSTTLLLNKTAAARAKIAEILLKVDFLKSVSQGIAEHELRLEGHEGSGTLDRWSAYSAANETHGRIRREAINRCAREDLQAIGRSIDALRRSRLMGLAAKLGLPASKELERLYEIYCASERH